MFASRVLMFHSESTSHTGKEQTQVDSHVGKPAPQDRRMYEFWQQNFEEYDKVGGFRSGAQVTGSIAGTREQGSKGAGTNFVGRGAELQGHIAIIQGVDRYSTDTPLRCLWRLWRAVRHTFGIRQPGVIPHCALHIEAGL